MTQDKRDLIAKMKQEQEAIQKDIDTIMRDEVDLKVERIGKLFKRVDEMPSQVKFETGIDWFDRETGGFVEGSFVNLAGESFGGKTTFALKVLENISKWNQVLFFSFEMYERLIREKLSHLDEMQQSNFLIEQKRHELGEIDTIVRSYTANGGKFVVIDSRMKIRVTGKQEEYQKNSEISKQLSKLCQETGAVILMINQISEGDLKSGRLSLKGSGDQYYDSDMVLFITVSESGERKMWCTKDRYGGRKWSVIMPDYSNNSEGVEITRYQENKIDVPLT